MLGKQNALIYAHHPFSRAVFAASLIFVLANHVCIHAHTDILAGRMDAQATSCKQAIPSKISSNDVHIAGTMVAVPTDLDAVLKCSWSTGVYALPHKKLPSWEGFARAAKAAGLVYWMADGAGLGAIRHGGPIPHDGDMDVVIPVWYQPLVSNYPLANETIRWQMY